MKSEILKLKLELKNLAKKIKIAKAKRCRENNGYVAGLFDLRAYYRHRHVLYCLARGRTLEQCDSGVGLNMKYINFMLDAMQNDKKLFVVVDAKLPARVQAVQCAHAVAAFLIKYPNTMWKNGTLVMLKGPVWAAPVYSYPREHASFAEPDLGNKITAYAAFGPGVEESLKDLPLV